MGRCAKSLMGLLFAATILSAQERPTYYVALQGAFVFSAGFDLASTLYYYPRCAPLGCAEQNRLLGPALKAGPIPTIMVATGLTMITVWAADRVWSHEKVGRHVWWLIPVAGTINHLLAAEANMALMQ